MAIIENFFSNLENLEPKCPKCGSILDYGTNTEYDEEKNAHICTKCGCVLK